MVIFGLGFGMNFSVWWYDIPEHMLGGAFCAVFFYYLFFERYKILGTDIKIIPAIILSLGFVALIGVVWEFYEFFTDFYFSSVYSFPSYYGLGHFGQSGIFDTIKDLQNDLFGGLIASLLIYLKLK